MSDDETLTDDELADLARGVPAYAERAKALRILDRQAKRIARALQILAEPRTAGSPEARLAGDVRRALE